MYSDASPMQSRRKSPRKTKRSSTLQDLLLTDNKAQPKGSRVSGIYEESPAGQEFLHLAYFARQLHSLSFRHLHSIVGPKKGPQPS